LASQPSIAKKEDSPRVGKVTHPAAGARQSPADSLVGRFPQQLCTLQAAFDSGIYLIKSGKASRRAWPDAASSRTIQSNHEQWPRALVPYKRHLWHR